MGAEVTALVGVGTTVAGNRSKVSSGVSSQEQSLSANSHCLQFLWFAWCSGKVFVSTNVEAVANRLLNLELSKIQAKQTAQTFFFCHHTTIRLYILSYAPVFSKRVLEVLDYDENIKGCFQSKCQFILATIIVLSSFSLNRQCRCIKSHSCRSL